MSRFFRIAASSAVGVLIVLLIASCADEQKPPEELVADRAQARLDSIVARDFAAAWEFHPPGFREKLPLQEFIISRNSRPVRWLGGEVTAVECREDICDVALAIKFRPLGGDAAFQRLELSQNISERWVNVSGQWWYGEES